MGRLVNGQWTTQWYSADSEGRFQRDPTQFQKRITADGSSGFKAESGRYHLYASWACPWAHRVLIMRKLKGLEDAIGLSIVDPFMGEDGWAFSDRSGSIPDPIHGAHFLREIYVKAASDYTGRVTVPVLWDKQRKTIACNESRLLLRDLDTEFDAIAKHQTSFCPPEQQQAIDAAISKLYEPVNNGVYRSGFAQSQGAYEEAVTELFAALDEYEDRLSRQRYLLGDRITEADWCFFTTLVRFDPVYHYHFKCNVRRIADYPNVHNYLKDLYQVPGVAETCNFDHIKHHYFASHESINPTRIVPKGPQIDLDGPHDRARF